MALSTTTPEHDERVRTMKFHGVYPHYVNKVVKKGRTEEELHQVIKWLTGFSKSDLDAMMEEQVTFEEFFDRATLHPNATLIKGVICGYRIEDLQTDLTRYCRYLDKVVDELAKGKAVEKIMREG